MNGEKLIDFRQFAAQIDKCKRPEDFFGELSAAPEDSLEIIRRTMVPLYIKYHPCRSTRDGGETLDLAHEIMGALEVLRNEAERKLAEGTYGQPDITKDIEPLFEIKSEERTYRVRQCIAEGDIAKLYAAEFDGPRGIETACVKICQYPENNRLILREADFLKSYRHKQVPAFMDSFLNEEGQQVAVMQMIDGFDMVTLREMPLYGDGVPLNHACWMMERSLSVLGNMHCNAVTLHGDITPWHLMVRPFDHKVFLVDFTYCVGDGGNYCLPATEIYGAPEIGRIAKPSPEADIFALGKTMVYLLGGDPENNWVPESVDRRIAEMLDDMTKRNPDQRSRNAWGLARRLSDIRLKIFGQRHEFISFATELPV